MPNLKIFREKQNKTQADIAALLPNTTVSDISKYENYVTVPTPQLLAGFVEAYGAPIPKLYAKWELCYSMFFIKYNKRKDCYKLTVRLPRKWKKIIMPWLRLLGYRTIEQWLLECIAQLEERVKQKEIA